jgi:hypothetical protein
MKVQTAKQMIRLQEWEAQLRASKQSGMTVRQWCKEQGISMKTYYYRMKRVREEMLEAFETKGGSLLAGIPAGRADGVTGQHEMLGYHGSRYPKKADELEFAAVSLPQTRSIAMTVRVGEYAVDIHNGADDILVGQVLRMVARL